MCDESGLRNPVEVLADDFLARQRTGEQPSLAEYAERYPDLADEIHELFPLLLEMEDVRQAVAEAPLSIREPLGAFPWRLGDYRVIREIGRGGMGVVYEAEQLSLGRRVALKVLSRAGLTPLQGLRFDREARSAAKLHHTNIVPVFGVGREADVRYYVMQYIPGQPLDEVFHEVRRLRHRLAHAPGVENGESAFPPRNPSVTAGLAQSLYTGKFAPAPIASGAPAGPSLAAEPTEADSECGSAGVLHGTGEPAATLNPVTPSSDVLSSSADLTGSGSRYCRAVARIGVQVADALDYAALQGIIHRDVKPSNILLDLYGTAWVTDFGLAKVDGQNDLTHSGDLVGTLRYMAPERFRGETDRRSDVYALGLTLYELLALQPAFKESDRVRLIRQVTEEGPTRLGKLDPSIPRDLETIVQKAAAREPRERYQTAAALASDLRRFLDDRPIAARRPSLFDRSAKWARRHRTSVITGTVGLLFVVSTLAGGVGWILRDRAARSDLTEREVNRALQDAAEFQNKARWSEALEAIKRAQGFVAVGSSEQLKRVVRERRTDADMVLRLEGIRQPRLVNGIEAGYEKAEWELRYAEAFRDYGIDVLALEPAATGALIGSRTIGRELTAALDHWADQRMRHLPAGDVSFRRLIAAARAADPDPWRDRLRLALEHGDLKKLNELAESSLVDDLPLPTLDLLLAHLDKRHQLPVLRRAQRQHPDDYWINFKLAYCLDYEPPPLQNQDEAIRFYTAAIACRPRNAPAHYYLGHALEQRCRIDEAIAAFRKAIELDPDFSWPDAGLSAIYLRRGEFELAIGECKRIIERNSKDAVAHGLLAKALGRLGRTRESIAEYETALALQPDVVEFQNKLAWILVTCSEKRNRNPIRGLELAQKAVERSPKRAGNWTTLGVALYRSSDWQGAIKALEKSIALQGFLSYDGFFLAMARKRLGQPEKARSEYDRAVDWLKQNKPKDDELLRFRAEAALLLQIDDQSPTVPK